MRQSVLLFSKYFIGAVLALYIIACNPARRPQAPVRPGVPTKPKQDKPTKPVPVDTIRWTPNNDKPPIVNEPGKPPTPNTGKPNKPAGNGATYQVAYLLPFLVNQVEGNSVPEKSRLAVQFYAGAKIALEEISKEFNINLVVDVYDTQVNDADFQKLLLDRKLEKAQVFIGPIRSSHVSTFAEWGKIRRKIMISPETPNSELTASNPGFIQTNPSLRAHCEAITRHVKKTSQPDAVTIVCKEKEVDRIRYFQDANTVMGNGKFNELRISDANNTFSGIDLKKFIKAGRTSVFILPHWANQDFVNSFLRTLKSAKGNNRVEVYGMPQWKGFESIETEFLTALNVKIAAATYIDYNDPKVKAFQQKFYDATGTIPDEDGINGYDVTLFMGRMLAYHSLSFPELLGTNAFNSLHGRFDFTRWYVTGGIDSKSNLYDYLENTHIHILKFGKDGYKPE